MPRFKILIIDDEKNTREGLSKFLSFDYDVTAVEDAFKGLALLKQHHYDMVLTDLNMPGMDGIEFTRQAKLMPDSPLIIMLTAYGSVEVAVEAMKAGAYDYLTKPVNLENLEMLIKRGVDSLTLKKENTILKQQLAETSGYSNIIGESSQMQQVFADIQQMAPAKATVLISGESGTGKEIVAEALHSLSHRKDKPFIILHCAALNANLLESELFGHEKGAFTGAGERKIGRIEMANGGSLFLDEIGEIDQATQVKLLRVLESRKFERVGGTASIKVDTRIICATNRNLKEEVEKGNFREDLYFRLSVLNIDLPPLRSRDGDVEKLLTHYLKIFAEENCKQIPGFQPEAVNMLKAYSWPGNVRELRNMVERMVVMSKGGYLSVGEIPAEIRMAIDTGSIKTAAAAEIPHVETLNIIDNEKHLIEEALEQCSGNVTHAAQKLGISRRTLQRKMKKYDLHK